MPWYRSQTSFYSLELSSRHEGMSCLLGMRVCSGNTACVRTCLSVCPYERTAVCRTNKYVHAPASCVCSSTSVAHGFLGCTTAINTRTCMLKCMPAGGNALHRITHTYTLTCAPANPGCLNLPASAYSYKRKTSLWQNLVLCSCFKSQLSLWDNIDSLEKTERLRTEAYYFRLLTWTEILYHSIKTLFQICESVAKVHSGHLGNAWIVRFWTFTSLVKS